MIAPIAARHVVGRRRNRRTPALFTQNIQRAHPARTACTLAVISDACVRSADRVKTVTASARFAGCTASLASVLVEEVEVGALLRQRQRERAADAGCRAGHTRAFFPRMARIVRNAWQLFTAPTRSATSAAIPKGVCMGRSSGLGGGTWPVAQREPELRDQMSGDSGSTLRDRPCPPLARRIGPWQRLSGCSRRAPIAVASREQRAKRSERCEPFEEKSSGDPARHPASRALSRWRWRRRAPTSTSSTRRGQACGRSGEARGFAALS